MIAYVHWQRSEHVAKGRLKFAKVEEKTFADVLANSMQFQTRNKWSLKGTWWLARKQGLWNGHRLFSTNIWFRSLWRCSWLQHPWCPAAGLSEACEGEIDEVRFLPDPLNDKLDSLQFFRVTCRKEATIATSRTSQRMWRTFVKLQKSWLHNFGGPKTSI